MRIGWVVPNVSARFASTRYRCYYAALALEAHGYESRIFCRSAEAISALDGLDAVVVVKQVDRKGAELASLAKARGKRVFIDLCDNVLVWSYERVADQRNVQHLVTASIFADAVIVASPALADAVRPALPASTRLLVIADQVETRQSVAAAEGLAVRASGGHFAIDATPRWRLGRASFLRRGSPLWRASAFAKFAVESPAEAAQVARRKLGLAIGAAGTAARAEPTAPHNGTIELPNPLAAIVASAAEGREPQRRSVLWFGNYGAPHSDFGMLALLKTVPALEAIARDIDIELVVVSNSAKTYAAYIAPMPIRSRYVPWSPDAVFEALDYADVCLLPFGEDDFSVTKSANRAVLALGHGVPVVASPLASHEPLRDCVVLGDWEAGLRRYVGADRAEARAEDVAAARPVLEAHYSPEATARAWLELFAVPPRTLHLGRPADRPRAEVAVLISLSQDLDLLLPVIDALRQRNGVRLKVLLAEGSVAGSQRVLRAMVERGIVPYALERELLLEGDDRIVRGLDALITGAETSLNPHRVPHALTRTANALGVRTYTLQHGLENVGLSYFDDVHDAGIEIAAQHILTWADPARLPEATPVTVRARSRAVGRTSKVDARCMPVPAEIAGRPTIGVFENLHWHRYSEAYRKTFLADMIGLARARSELAVMVKPHHAGLFLIKDPALLEAAPTNLIIVDPRDPRWEPYTAPAMIPLCKAVITTPSTVALDAAELDVPVAVAAYDLKLPVFEGLPELRKESDWREFVAGALADPGAARASTAAFRERVRMPGDAAERIAQIVLAAASHCGGQPDCVSVDGESRPAKWPAPVAYSD